MWIVLSTLLVAYAGDTGVAAIPGVSAALPAPVSAGAWSAALEDAIVAAPSWSARRERVTAALASADGERAGRLGQLLAVLGSLERTGRADPSVVRLFARAALAEDATVRAAAVDAAARGGDPPLVGVAGPGVAAAAAAPAPVAAPAPAGGSAAAPAPAGGPLPFPATVGAGAVGPAAVGTAAAPPVNPTARIPGFAAAVPAPSAPASGALPAPATGAGPASAASVAVTAASPPVAAKPPPSLETLRAYKARRLVRSGTTTINAMPLANGYGTVLYSSDSWKVSDGGGAPLSGQDFARLTNDTAKLAAYRKRIETGWVWMVGLGGAGTLMLGGFLATADDVDVGSILLLLGGTAGVASCWLPPVLAHQYRGSIARSYVPSEVDRRIEAYNASLRADLGLTEADVKDIDLGARAPTGITVAFAPTGIYGTF